MNTCPDHVVLQDYLDDELSAPLAREVRAHVETCARCTRALAGYRSAFAALDRVTLVPASPVMVERILSRVLPSRQRRRRWIAALGWGYGAATAACLLGVGAWLTNPAGRALLADLTGEMSRRLVSALIFTLNAISFTVIGLANGWGLVSAIGTKLAPFGRALAALLAMPGLEAALWLAAAACAGLLWWMRPRDPRRSSRGIRHVGLLGF